jgi:hypothetical protein
VKNNILLCPKARNYRMKRRKARKDEKILHFKVVIPFFDNHQSKELLEDSPYRIIAVPERFTLCEFAEAINESFNFDFDHLFAFYDNLKKPYASKRIYAFKNQDYYDKQDLGDVEKARLEDVFPRKGKTWLYIFDFGTEWHFWISLVDKLDADAEIKYPEVIETFGKAPSQYDDDEFIDEEMFNQKANELIDEALKSLQKLKSAVTPKLPTRVLTEAEKIALLKTKLKQGKLEFSDENLLVYSKYLGRDLEFPIDASFIEDTDIFGQVTTKVQVTSILPENSINTNDGVKTQCTYGYQTIKVPLAKLSLIQPGTNRRLVEQYKRWFKEKPQKF